MSEDERTSTFEVNGQRVRVAKPGQTLEGSLQALDETTLFLRGTGGSPSIVIPRKAILGLDTRRRESKKVAGLLIGALAGGAIGYAVGAATSGPGCRGGETGFDSLCSLDSAGKAAGAVLGVAGGALLGLIVAPGTKWEKNVPLDHVQLGLGPRCGRGFGLSISLAF